MGHKSKIRKIIIVSDLHPKLILGGGQVIAYEFFVLLQSLGYKAEFWYTFKNNGGAVPNHAEFERQISFSKNRFRIFSKIQEIVSLRILIKFTRLILITRPSHVWINQIGNNWPFLIILILKIFRIKIIVTLHDYLIISQYKLTALPNAGMRLPGINDMRFTFYQKLRYLFFRFCINKSNINVAVSEIQSDILQNFGVKIHCVIRNGVNNCTHINRMSGSHPQRTSNSNILFAGRLHLKGLDILIKSILNSKVNWVLNLAGNKELLEFASKNLLSSQYIYHGFLSREELALLIHDMDLVFACSQYFDPYPTICLESLRHGVTFLTSETSGTSALYDGELAKNLVFPVGAIPDIDLVNSFSLENRGEILNCAGRIPDASLVLRQYLDLFD